MVYVFNEVNRYYEIIVIDSINSIGLLDFYLLLGGYDFTLFFLLAGLCKKTTKPIFTKFRGKVAHEPRKSHCILVVIRISLR